jgi:hypothetical protein
MRCPLNEKTDVKRRNRCGSMPVKGLWLEDQPCNGEYNRRYESSGMRDCNSSDRKEVCEGLSYTGVGGS